MTWAVETVLRDGDSMIRGGMSRSVAEAFADQVCRSGCRHVGPDDSLTYYPAHMIISVRVYKEVPKTPNPAN